MSPISPKNIKETNFVKKIKEAFLETDKEKTVYKIIDRFSALIETYFKGTIVPEEIVMIRNAVYTAIDLNPFDKDLRFYDFLSLILRDTEFFHSLNEKYVRSNPPMTFWREIFQEGSRKNIQMSQACSRLESICSLITYGFDFDELFLF